MVGTHTGVQGITRTTFPRQSDDRVTQLFVVSRVPGDVVSHTVTVTHHNRISGTSKPCQEWIANSQSTDVSRSDVTYFSRPTPPQFSLQRQVELLRVRRVRVNRSAGKRCEIDNAVGCGTTIVQTPLSVLVNKDWTDVGVVDVQWSNTADAP